MKKRSTLTALLAASLGAAAPGAPHADEGMLRIKDVTYLGAFRITDGRYGESKTGWSRAQIAVSPSTDTFFMGGSDIYSVGEFQIPELVKSDNIDDLNFTGEPVQPYVRLLDKPGMDNPQNLNIMTGMKVLDGALVVNGVEQYNPAGDNDDTTLIVEDAFDLKGSGISGFKKLTGAAHSSGWLTPIPGEHRTALGGDYIAGYSSVHSINGRFSIGPSAFILNIADIDRVEDGGVIPAKAVIDYPLYEAITDKNQYNYEDGVVLDNDLWTETSTAVFGMIVPGTSTYFTLGASSGHEFGLGYKIVQKDTGYRCGGACPFYASDSHNYAWLFDVDDMVSAGNGERVPSSIRPYEYGKFELELEDADGNGIKATIASADYDAENQILYIVYGRGDLVQAQFSPLPLVLAYKFDLEPASGGMCRVRPG